MGNKLETNLHRINNLWFAFVEIMIFFWMSEELCSLQFHFIIEWLFPGFQRKVSQYLVEYNNTACTVGKNMNSHSVIDLRNLRIF